jgi:indole-3-glycerol phosphate synthase
MAEMAATVLEEILVARRRRVEQDRARVPLEQLRETAQARGDFRDFVAAVSGAPLRVIAELKRASPSAGMLRDQYRPAELARSYAAGGAAALSVLTEPDYFLGSLDHLGEARQVVRLPVLRKDFVVDEYQVFESAAGGADAVLLIVAALTDRELRRLIELCDRLRLATLVEVHSEEELGRALRARARLIGVNNRNLKTLEVDLETSFRLRPLIPNDCVAVSESGIQSAADLRRLSEAGFSAALMGEHFMRASDPGKELARLRAAAGI